MTFKTLLGLPELAPDRMESKLLWGSRFSRITRAYVVVIALTLPGLYLITVLEERELLVRFGDEYRQYQDQVPRFLPRLTS